MNCDVKSFWAFTLNGLDEVILPRVVTCFQPSQNFVSPLSPSLSRAMVISFIPAIDEVAHVAIPEWHATDSTVELRFSAVLGDEDFQQFKKNGMKVQVWSNIPLGRRNEGEWGEIDLHEANEPASVGSSDDSQISLVALEDVKAKAENVLFAICSVPFSGSSDDYYSFTYRIVYPSGEIHWLGQFGQNGMVHINTASKNDSGIVFEEGLEANTAPFAWNTRGRQVEDLLIAQVAHPEDWSVWTVGKDRHVFSLSQIPGSVDAHPF